MTSNFYRSFEDKHRGPRELIKRRLLVYLPFVEQIKQLYSTCTAVDLGCGRGEWLEVLRDQGVSAHGVDLDDHMLAACRELELSTETADAVTYLTGLPDANQDIVSGFHIAEHLPFSDLQKLVSEALRVLKPAGLLILETPNPENIVVGVTKFYLDPTHKRPIPPQLLSFLPEFYGFARTKTLRLQESKALVTNESPTLSDVLAGVSPDYAVIAQKPAHAETLERFDEVFDQEYGLSLINLAERFDNRFQQTEVKAQQAEVKAQQAEVKAQQAEVKAQQAEVKAQQAEVKAQQAEVKAQQAEVGLQAVHNSRSWQLTKPLRLVDKAVRWLVQGTVAWMTLTPESRPRRVVRNAVLRLKMFFCGHPRLKTLALRWLTPFPRLKARLKALGSQPHPTSRTISIEGPEQLSPRGRQIYKELKAAIEQRQKEKG